MTKDVLISINGLQFIRDDVGMGPVEVVTPGEYYKKNGNYYLLFDESTEGFQETTHNMIKFRSGCLEVRKNGLVNADMLFETDKKTFSIYQTPFGSMRIGIAATGISIRETDERIDLQVDYALDINDDFVADCVIKMNATPRTGSHFTLS